jgi:hypothetical protein
MSIEVKSLSSLALTIKTGLYKHFKGGEYEVIGVGRMSEEREEEMVIYKSLEAGYIWIRPLQMFLEEVERDGYKGPRFKYVGE